MIPRIRIAHLPTPVEAMPRLTAALGGPRLWVKRDDQTGLAFGGNKTRKLEYVLAEAQANGAKTLVTIGSVQSNHCRQTAALAARYGLECILVLSDDGGLSLEELGGNRFLDDLFGAEIVRTTHDERDAVLQQTFNQAWTEGRRPYLIPMGASMPIGAVAYAMAFAEFLVQDTPVDWIVFPSSSAGTQAGLVVGARKAGWPGKVLGISVDHPAETLRGMVASLATQTADRMDLKYGFLPDDILVNDEYLGAGYAKMDEPEIEAIRLFARTEGLVLDPVYTGRAAAGLIGLIRQGYFNPHERILFWHTGGTPALFAPEYLEKIAHSK